MPESTSPFSRRGDASRNQTLRLRIKCIYDAEQAVSCPLYAERLNDPYIGRFTVGIKNTRLTHVREINSKEPRGSKTYRQQQRGDWGASNREGREGMMVQIVQPEYVYIRQQRHLPTA